jgi:hypothetical protein
MSMELSVEALSVMLLSSAVPESARSAGHFCMQGSSVSASLRKGGITTESSMGSES